MKTLLVTLDGSPTSRIVLERAESLARVFGSKLILFRVIETGARPGGLADAVDSRLARAEAMAYLGAIGADPKDRGLEVEIDVGIGDPATEILRVAAVSGADLVVLGPNRGANPQDFLGGTALKIAARSETSLFMVRPDDLPEDNDQVKTVLAAVDGCPGADWAAFHAAALAQAQDAELLLVHVLVEPELIGAPTQGSLCDLAASLLRTNRIAAWEHLERLRRQLRRPGLRIRAEVANSRNAAEGLAEVVAKKGIHLVVVGAGGQSTHIGRHHGSVADALLVSGATSVLVCQHAAPRSSQSAFDRRVATRPDRLRYAPAH